MARNRNVLLYERAEHYDAADGLTKAAVERGRDLTAEEKKRLQEHMAAMEKIDAEISRLDAGFPVNGNKPTPVVMPGASQANEPTIGRIFAKGQSIEEYVRRQGNDPHANISLGEICKSMALGGGRPEIRAALAEGTDSAGGYTVPSILSSQLIDMLRAKSTVFAAGAQTMTLETGKSTTLAAIASDPVSGWRAENASVSTSDMTFSPISFTPKTLGVIVTASRELVEDSLNLQTAIMTSLSKSFAAEIDRAALIGSGTSNQPKGVSLMSGVGSVSMGTNGLAPTNFDQLVQAVGTLRTANASDPTAYICHPRTDQEYNLLKDSQNRPLIPPDVVGRIPRLVTSKLSITETQGSANTASRIIMGNFADLVIGIRHQVSIELLREKYADVLQYGFLCFARIDVAALHTHRSAMWWAFSSSSAGRD